jgi:ABC-type nitrate/sulfonate/bicarbonate transport systems, periplasmic components
VRGDHGRNLDFLECQWCCDQADLPARQELRRRRHGTRNDVASIKDLKGKTIAASAPGTPLFRAGLDAQEERPLGQGRTVVNLEPAAAAQAFVSGQNDAP